MIIVNTFEAPIATVSLDAEKFDLIDTLEGLSKEQLDRLEDQQCVFSEWLHNQLKYRFKDITLSMDVTHLLINCWLASKEYNKNNAI
jgi:hypothetical protein